jgi:hypothetical protein
MLVLSTVVPSPEHNLIIELFYFETVWKLQRRYIRCTEQAVLGITMLVLHYASAGEYIRA